MSHQLEQWDARTHFKGCPRLLCENRLQKSKHREGKDQRETCPIIQRENVRSQGIVFSLKKMRRVSLVSVC